MPDRQHDVTALWPSAPTAPLVIAAGDWELKDPHADRSAFAWYAGVIPDGAGEAPPLANLGFELLKSLVKVVIVGFAINSVLGRETVSQILATTQESPIALLQVVQHYAVRLVMTAGLAYLGLALADYLWQYWQYVKELRMTKEEIKQEHKQSEGDPHLKQRMRAVARSMARKSAARLAPKRSSNRPCACAQASRPASRLFSPAFVRWSSLARPSLTDASILIRPSRSSGNTLRPSVVRSMTISLARALIVIGPSRLSFAKNENCVTCSPAGARNWS